MEHQHLHLLVHDLEGLPRMRSPLRRTLLLRRGVTADEQAIMAVDEAAFDPEWRLGPGGLAQALAATPLARQRVATEGPGRPVVGYSVSGVAAGKGYLQRLAVAPPARRLGLGSELVLDALLWMRRRWVHEVLVNTQAGNDAALQLYLRLGFRLVRTGPMPAGTAHGGLASPDQLPDPYPPDGLAGRSTGRGRDGRR